MGWLNNTEITEAESTEGTEHNPPPPIAWERVRKRLTGKELRWLHWEKECVVD